MERVGGFLRSPEQSAKKTEHSRTNMAPAERDQRVEDILAAQITADKGDIPLYIRKKGISW